MTKTLYVLLLATPLASACTAPVSETAPLLNQENDGGRSSPENPYQSYIDLAKCLVSEKVDARVYNIAWSPTCQLQKFLFSPPGWEIMKANEIICSDYYQNPFSEECLKEGIVIYPAWKFKTHAQPVYGLIPLWYDSVKKEFVNGFEVYTHCKIE